MATYTIDQKTVDIFSSFYQERLQLLYAGHERIACGCILPHPLMYIARVNGKFSIKRMPNTGVNHDAGCASYEPPIEVSGLGGVVGQAIQEDPLSGKTIIRAGFALVHKAKSTVMKEEGEESNTSPKEANSILAQRKPVTAKVNKLTLLGLLHYLWEETKLNRWYPAMLGKRHWYVVRHHIVGATDNIVLRDQSLKKQLLIPKYFTKENEDQLARRRAGFIKARSLGKADKQLVLFLGEVGEIRAARYGHLLKLKDWPDFPLFYDEDFQKQLVKKYANEVAFFRSYEKHHLMAIGTFAMNAANMAEIQSVSLMMVNEHWIPYETVEEACLIGDLVEGGYAFTKGLRYNIGMDRPLATAVITEKGETPTALYLVPTEASETYRQVLDELVAASQLKSWIWNLSDEQPELPPMVVHETPTIPAEIAAAT